MHAAEVLPLLEHALGTSLGETVTGTGTPIVTALVTGLAPRIVRSVPAVPLGDASGRAYAWSPAAGPRGGGAPSGLLFDVAFK
jgi:hypothetical protein